MLSWVKIMQQASWPGQDSDIGLDFTNADLDERLKVLKVAREVS